MYLLMATLDLDAILWINVIVESEPYTPKEKGELYIALDPISEHDDWELLDHGNFDYDELPIKFERWIKHKVVCII